MISVADIGVISNVSLWSSLVAGWKLDNNFNDVLGVANGTPINGAGFTTGKINEGFNGIVSYDYANAKYVDFGNSIAQRNLQFPITLSSWIKHSYSTTYGGCIPFWLDGDYMSPIRGGVWLQITNLNFIGGSARVRAGFGDGTGAAISSSSVKEWRTDFVLPKDTWMHVVVVFIDANTIRIYVNGIDTPAAYLSGTATQIGWSGQKTIMGLANNYNADFNSINPSYEGAIDETYVWNRVLSQIEILALYNNGNGKQYPN
jgi:hypothetical protein